MNTSIPTTPEISTRLLFYRGEDKQFTAFASDLGLSSGRLPGTLSVRSHKTGNVRVFRMVANAMNEGGELLHVDYRCSGDTTCPTLTLRIFND